MADFGLQDLASIVEESRKALEAMRAEVAAAQAARDKQTEQIAQLQRDLVFARSQPPAPPPAERPWTWVKESHDPALVRHMAALGDMPRLGHNSGNPDGDVELDVGGGVYLSPGYSNLFVRFPDGKVAALRAVWTE